MAMKTIQELREASTDKNPSSAKAKKAMADMVKMEKEIDKFIKTASPVLKKWKMLEKQSDDIFGKFNKSNRIKPADPRDVAKFANDEARAAWKRLGAATDRLQSLEDLLPDLVQGPGQH